LPSWRRTQTWRHTGCNRIFDGGRCLLAAVEQGCCSR
jgi:hypothetical protein